jgi:hypothetical protein
MTTGSTSRGHDPPCKNSSTFGAVPSGSVDEDGGGGCGAARAGGLRPAAIARWRRIIEVDSRRKILTVEAGLAVPEDAAFDGWDVR